MDTLPGVRRLITSRGVWLALLAAVAAAGIVLFVRARKPEPRPVSAPPPAEEEKEAPWPPVPILGVPTAEDLRRYEPRPSILDRPAVARFLAPREPRPPLDPVTRRWVTRWGVAALALVVLAGCTHLVESAVFSKSDDVTMAVDLPSGDDPCADPAAACVSTLMWGEPTMTNEHPVAPPPDPRDADCLPGDAAPRAQQPDPKVTRAVNRQWRRIERWLKANAPKTHRALGKPARPGAVATAEARMGLRFPDDFKASLLRHNGGFGFLGSSSVGVQDIHEAWGVLCSFDDQDIGDPRADWWDGRMIPFAADGSGNHLVIDSVQKDIGTTDHEGGMRFRPGGVRIRSYHALLKATADALESGGSVGWWKPVADGGTLGWEVL